MAFGDLPRGKVTIVDKDEDQAEIDDNTNTLVFIDFPHHKIHEGKSFTCHYSNDITAVNEQTGIAFNTPNTTNWIHMFFRAESSTLAYAAIYEVADLDNDEGTDLTIYNRNRNSSTASTVSTVEATPEVGKATSYNETQLAGATLSTTNEIMKWYIGTNEWKGDPGAGIRTENEFILKANTQYCFLLNSLSIEDGTHNIALSWYEHQNN